MENIKNYLALLLIFAILPIQGQNTLTKEERKRAENVLENSRTELTNAVKGLSAEQLAYKPSEDAWSIADCVEHLAVSEGMMNQMIQQSLTAPPDPAVVQKASMADNELYALITDRSSKIKTAAPMEPKNTYQTYKDTYKAYDKQRNETLKFVRTTKADLRRHFSSFPFGQADAYQMLLFIAGHNMRHLDQINEIKASPGFPQS